MGSPKVVAAAHAAASWARARRATWAEPGAPLPAAEPAPEPPRQIVAEAAPVVVSPTPTPPATPIERAPEPVKIPTPKVDWLGPALGTLGHWLPRAAVGLAILAAGVYGGRFAWSRISALRSRVDTPAAAPAATPAATRPPASGRRTGTLHVTSTPPGAQVTLDGKARGVTPLTLSDLPTGNHALELTSAQGTVSRGVTVAADRTTEVAESIFSGWVAVQAPFDLSITEGARALRADDRGQVLLPPGPHDLRFVNRTLGYDQVHHVEVKPGEIATLSIPLPRSTLTVTASEPAEVLVDGAKVGDTPLADAAVDVGTREIVVRRTSGGAERRVTATVTMKPYTLTVDFSR